MQKQQELEAREKKGEKKAADKEKAAKALEARVRRLAKQFNKERTLRMEELRRKEDQVTHRERKSNRERDYLKHKEAKLLLREEVLIKNLPPEEKKLRVLEGQLNEKQLDLLYLMTEVKTREENIEHKAREVT